MVGLLNGFELLVSGQRRGELRIAGKRRLRQVVHRLLDRALGQRRNAARNRAPALYQTYARYVEERKQTGKEIVEFQMVKPQVADTVDPVRP